MKRLIFPVFPILLCCFVLLASSIMYYQDCFIGLGVSSGTSNDPAKFRNPYKFYLPVNPQTGEAYLSSDVVGIGIDGENNNNLAWFKNGYVSVGNSNKLGSRMAPYKYTLPVNPQTNRKYKPKDILAMAVDGFDNYCFAWYKNGYVSAGSSNDLGKYRQPYRFSLARSFETGNSYSPNDVIGIAIDGNNDHCFVWYKDGYVSAGASNDLDKYRLPYRILRKPAKNIRTIDVIDCGIDGENNQNYFWFKGKDAKVCG